VTARVRQCLRRETEPGIITLAQSSGETR
jgi:hypothetical protein